MKEENLDIFSERGVHIGIATRSEVHAKGYWHNTFHCWLVSRENGNEYILFQKRHPQKDTYPNLLDITSAGHLLAGEKVADGVREVEEELGIAVSFDRLVPLGVFQEKFTGTSMLDNEFCHTFLYECNLPLDDFQPQLEEVVGIVKIKLDEMIRFFSGLEHEVKACGFVINGFGHREIGDFQVKRTDFVPRQGNYYVDICKLAKKYLSGI